MKVLCLSGWKQSGKDTLADRLVSKYRAKRVSFADPLKDMAALEYGVERSWFDDPAKKESPLLHMPVEPQDPFSRLLIEFMYKEFRTASGAQADHFHYMGKDFYGAIPSGQPGPYDLNKLYWTPRALAILKGSSNRATDSSFWVKRAITQIAGANQILGKDMFVISDLRYQSEMAQLKTAFGEDAVFIRINRFDESPSSDPSERNLDEVTFDFYIENKGTKEQAYAQLDEIIARL